MLLERGAGRTRGKLEETQRRSCDVGIIEGGTNI